jgi:hypothetical protein
LALLTGIARIAWDRLGPACQDHQYRDRSDCSLRNCLNRNP